MKLLYVYIIALISMQLHIQKTIAMELSGQQKSMALPIKEASWKLANNKDTYNKYDVTSFDEYEDLDYKTVSIDIEPLYNMLKTINEDNTRIGDLSTLVLSALIQKKTYLKTLKKITNHTFIRSDEIITRKSYHIERNYNPFTIIGSCYYSDIANNNSTLSNKLKEAVETEFITEHQRNSLNDIYFLGNDRGENFKQVDYCTSAKIIDIPKKDTPEDNQPEKDTQEITKKQFENKIKIYYITRFYNKECLLETLKILSPIVVAEQVQKDIHAVLKDIQATTYEIVGELDNLSRFIKK